MTGLLLTALQTALLKLTITLCVAIVIGTITVLNSSACFKRTYLEVFLCKKPHLFLALTWLDLNSFISCSLDGQPFVAAHANEAPPCKYSGFFGTAWTLNHRFRPYISKIHFGKANHRAEQSVQGLGWDLNWFSKLKGQVDFKPVDFNLYSGRHPSLNPPFQWGTYNAGEYCIDSRAWNSKLHFLMWHVSRPQLVILDTDENIKICLLPRVKGGRLHCLRCHGVPLCSELLSDISFILQMI